MLGLSSEEVNHLERWLLLSYTLPAEPSSQRVLVWRHMRKLGAMLDAGVWLLPRTDALEREFKGALAEIQGLGGHALAFTAADFTPQQAEDLRARFNALRREEYADLQQKCGRYLAHINRLIAAGNFQFTAIEELEEDLEKRRRAFAQISARDAFEIEERAQVEASLQACQAALITFVEQAFLKE